VSNWPVKPITEIVDFNPLRKIKKGSTAPFIEMAALPINARKITGVGEREFKGLGSKFQNGDTLFARITPCLENGKSVKVTVLDNDDVAHGSTEFIVMSAKNKEYDEDFVYYISRLPEFRNYAQSRMEGTSGRQRVSWQALAAYELPIPPREVRKQIGEILCSIDDKIELNRQVNQTLEQIAQAIFKSWFVDFDPVKAKIEAKQNGQDPERAAMCAISGKTEEQLDQVSPEQHQELATIASLFPDALEDSELGKIPKGWKWKSLGDVVKNFDSKRIPLSKKQRQERKGKYPYYGAAALMDYVDDYIFDGTYVLMAEDGTVMDKDGYPTVQYVWGKFWVNNHAHVLKGVGSVSDENILLYLKNTMVAPYVTGAVQLKINQKNMNLMPFLKANDEVHIRFSGVVKSLYSRCQVGHNQNLSLSGIRNSLLPRLLSGQLAVT